MASTPEPRTGSAHRSAQIQDEPAGNRLGNLGAVVVFDQCQREVDAGGDSSRGPHLLRTAYEDRVGIDPNGRKFAGEMFGKGPVRRRSVSVQQPGFGRKKRARAHGDDAAGGAGDGFDQSMRAGSDRAASTPAPPGRITVSTGSPGNPTITTLRAMNASVGQALAWRPRHTPHRLGHAGGAALPERPCTGLGRLCPWHR